MKKKKYFVIGTAAVLSTVLTFSVLAAFDAGKSSSLEFCSKATRIIWVPYTNTNIKPIYDDFDKQALSPKFKAAIPAAVRDLFDASPLLDAPFAPSSNELKELAEKLNKGTSEYIDLLTTFEAKTSTSEIAATYIDDKTKQSKVFEKLMLVRSVSENTKFSADVRREAEKLEQIYSDEFDEIGERMATSLAEWIKKQPEDSELIDLDTENTANLEAITKICKSIKS
jgi:RNA processing factor Prp31